jgi:UDP-3-O-[3-hydroxymyristoyl] N-acetylglucosamine deacetylase
MTHIGRSPPRFGRFAFYINELHAQPPCNARQSSVICEAVSGSVSSRPSMHDPVIRACSDADIETKNGSWRDETGGWASVSDASMGRGSGMQNGHWTGHRQTTVSQAFTLSGVGVHGGSQASVTIHPAAADFGIQFLRTDVAMADGQAIPARHDRVAATELATVVGDPAKAAVSTIEHLMAALFGMGIDNALVEIDGPEVPVLDGSAALFCDQIARGGITLLARPRRFIEVLEPIRVQQGTSFAELLPNDTGFRIETEIAFDDAVIGRQRITVDLTPSSFRRELARARTFGFMRDVEKLWAHGFALGASMENCVVVNDEGVMNRDGLRYRDEFVRHKALDAVGDLALAGLPLLATYRSHRGGHRLNASVLKALFADPTAYRVVDSAVGRRVPAAGAWGAVAAAHAPAV